MKLTDPPIKQALAEGKVVVVRQGILSLGLSQDCYEEVLTNLGVIALKDWELVRIEEDKDGNRK